MKTTVGDYTHVAADFVGFGQTMSWSRRHTSFAAVNQRKRNARICDKKLGYRATRLEVSQGHQTWYHSIRPVLFLLVCYSNFVPKTCPFSDIRLQKCRELENRVRGPSRSLKMSPFDKAYMTS